MFKWITKEQKKELQEFKLLKDFNNIDIQIGWFDSLKEMIKEIEDYCSTNNIELPNVLQIKTKFGTLRFYNRGIVDKGLEQIIDKWHKNLSNTCEYCGSKHNVITIIRDRVVLTLCEEERLDTDIDYNEFIKAGWN